MPKRVDTKLKAEFRTAVEQRFSNLVSSSKETEESYYVKINPELKKGSYYNLVKYGEAITRAAAIEVLKALKYTASERDKMLVSSEESPVIPASLSEQSPEAKESVSPNNTENDAPFIQSDKVESGTGATSLFKPTKRDISNVEDQPVTPLVRGRQNDLNWLINTFFPQGERSTGIKAAITGVGGMGKTTLALVYAQSFANRYSYRFFCRADSQVSLTNSLLTVAELLKEEDPEIRRFVTADQNRQDYIPNVLLSVRNWLRRSSDYLLILDNADVIPTEAKQTLTTHTLEDGRNSEIEEWQASSKMLTEEELGTLLPNLALFQGHVLVTSRNQVVSEVLGFLPTRVLDEMTAEAAETFLLDRTERTKSSLPLAEQEALLQLVVGLYGLPLALEQAGAYIREKDQPFSTYLGIYQQALSEASREQLLIQEEHKVGVLERQGPRLGQYRSSVAKTWLISFVAIEAELPAAAEAFTLSAFLDPDATPIELLFNASGVLQEDGTAVLPYLYSFFSEALDEAKIEDCSSRLLQPLIRYSLIKKNFQPAQTFRTHRLVQAVRRRTLLKPEWQLYFNASVKTLLNAFQFQ